MSEMKQEPGVCPNCGSDNIDYLDGEVDCEIYVYKCCCTDCDTQFNEYYNMTYADSEITYKGETK